MTDQLDRCARCLGSFTDGRDIEGSAICAGCMTTEEAVAHYALRLGLALEADDWPGILSAACGIAVAAGRRLGVPNLDLDGGQR